MKAVICFLLFAVNMVAAQPATEQKPEVFVSTFGKAHFFSQTPLENIEAANEKAVLALNITNGKVSARIPIRSFQFEKALMQEHFNEKYLESEKYPTATFTGSLLEKIDYGVDSTYAVTIKGVLEVHGVKKERTIAGKLTVKNGLPAAATADFNVALKSHKIKIPKILFQNIAEQIAIDVMFNLFEPYIKK